MHKDLRQKTLVKTLAIRLKCAILISDEQHKLAVAAIP